MTSPQKFDSQTELDENSVIKVETVYIKEEAPETHSEDKHQFSRHVESEKEANIFADDSIGNQCFRVKDEEMLDNLEEECEIENKNSIDKLSIDITKNILNESDGRKSTKTEDIKDSKKKKHCSQCSYKTAYRYDLRKHIMNHHTPPHLINWLYCTQCSYKAKEKAYLNSHMSSRHCKERLAKCKNCDFTTTNLHLLRNHMNNKHTPVNFKWFCCEHCSYKGKTKYSLHSHVLCKHTSEDSIKWQHCDHCTFKSKTRKNLTKHVSSVHSDVHKLR